MVEMEAAKNKTQFMAHVMKDEIFNTRQISGCGYSGKGYVPSNTEFNVY